MDFRKRPTLKHVSSLFAGLIFAAGTLAQTSSRPITLLVPYPVGGVSDVIARLVSPVLSRQLGQAVVVENLGGVGGAIAAQRMLRQPADGQTLFQGSPNELILTPMAIGAVKYKAEDFRPVQNITLNEMVMFVRKDLPVSNGDEFAAHAAKLASEGRQLTYASVGNGSLYHILGAHLSKRLGIPMKHMPYRGSAHALQDLIVGQVDIFITPYDKSYPELVGQGKIKALAALSAQRQKAFKSVPTLHESEALKGFVFDTWQSYFVPKDTPEPIVRALHKALNEVVNDAELRVKLEAQGMVVPRPATLEQLARSYSEEITQYRAIAKSIKLQEQNGH